MKKYEVRWKETRVISCSAEVEANSADEAAKLAQDYDYRVDVNESPNFTVDIEPAKVTEIEE